MAVNKSVMIELGQKLSPQGKLALGKLRTSISDIGEMARDALDFGKYLAAGAGAAIYASMPFEEKLAEISTLLDTARVDMGEVREQLVGLSKETGKGPSELAEAFYQALSAGVDYSNAMEFVRTSTKAAIGGVAEAAEPVDLLTTAINAYGLEAKEAGRISDIVFATIFQGKTRMSDLAESMGEVLPYASQLNVSLEDIFAATATLTKGGIKTAQATTQLKGVLRAVIKPSDEAAKTAKQLGLEFDVASVQSMGFFNWLMKVKEVAGDDTEALGKLFPNIRGLGAVLNLTGKQAQEFGEIQQFIANSSGAAEKAFQKVISSDSGKIKKGWNELKNVVIAFGDELQPSLIKFFEFVRNSKELAEAGKASLDFFEKLPGVVDSALGKVDGLFKKISWVFEKVREFQDWSSEAAGDTTKYIYSITTGEDDFYRDKVAKARGNRGEVDKAFRAMLRRETVRAGLNPEETMKDNHFNVNVNIEQLAVEEIMDLMYQELNKAMQKILHDAEVEQRRQQMNESIPVGGM